ncbi:NAD(P)-dependent oxidoreductase [Iodidimonas nitroreducens]|uniref:NAD(P)-dependent oxidoreductase n=1 Tax=Iodidimonas nitroreducens TaxID=1236968 RepID=A0A5A7N8M7_9PROT|nr:SDR family oxidoreductase [Iodidimonas nitroreducens]GAK34252.1 protein YeeZ [alpha proteobacterium Q-1]GER04701.1 NAD(P)-dependent oxidoreductase [Iodidimonas nitroreducens]
MADERLFCFGLGYSARALAARLKGQGWTIAGTARTIEGCAELIAMGYEAHLFDGTKPMDDRGLAALMAAGFVLSSAPPFNDDPDDGLEAGGNDPVLRHHGADLADFASCPSGAVRWLGYLSTTGVYGDHQGGWVDETTPPTPATDRGGRRVLAEQAWLGLRAADGQGLPVHVFRLAGIYGPGRSPFDALRAGRAQRIAKPGQVFSRIHVDDIAQVLMASMARPRAGAVYNVCDDLPAASSDVTAFAADLLGLGPIPEIPFEQAQLSPMARSFYADNKRVANRLIHDELGVDLAYPDYRAGLCAILDAEGARAG